MDYIQKFTFWRNNEFFSKEIREELSSLNPERDQKEIEDRFYKELEFGTGGLRGLMGAGTNRMNQYTVGKATEGLGRYLQETFGETLCQTRGVVIGYDTRNNSFKFAETAAQVLSGKGIRVYLHQNARPTPQLSFSVQYLKALAGIVITASHNPKEYNGYKVYDEHGCQLVPDQAKQVIAFVNSVEDYTSIDFKGNNTLVTRVDLTNEFVQAVLKQSRYKDEEAKANLHIVYTPLHGTGRIPVLEALHSAGFKRVDLVEEQAVPDGNFPTVSSPNPEDRRALEIGISAAEKRNADIVLGTDPDSDRVGAAVRTADGFRLISGNQMGALLMDFVLKHTNLKGYEKPAVIKTVVTSELGAEIAREKGISVFSTLTGFKFIGEKITQFESAKRSGDQRRCYDFIFGYEESYGYLAGTHARDKDAVVSSLLICEMASELKKTGKTLIDRMNELYSQYGYYKDALDSYTLKGKDGLANIASMMRELRCGEPLFSNVEKVLDYKEGVDAEPGFGKLPSSDVLKYILNDGSWIAIRPSGTEPKIKIYYSIKSEGETQAVEKLDGFRKVIGNRLGLQGE